MSLHPAPSLPGFLFCSPDPRILSAPPAAGLARQSLGDSEYVFLQLFCVSGGPSSSRVGVSSSLLTLAASCGDAPVPARALAPAVHLPHTLIPLTHFDHLWAESPAGPQSLLGVRPMCHFRSLSNILSQYWWTAAQMGCPFSLWLSSGLFLGWLSLSCLAFPTPFSAGHRT